MTSPVVGLTSKMSVCDVEQPSNSRPNGSRPDAEMAKAKCRVAKSANKRAKSSQHKKRKCLHPLCDKIDFLRGMKEITQFLGYFYSVLSREYFDKFYPEYTSHPEERDEMAQRLFLSLSDLDVLCRTVSHSYHEDIDTKIKLYSACRTDFPTPTPKLDNFQTIPSCLCSYGLYLSRRVTKKSFHNKDDRMTASMKSELVGRRSNLHRKEQFYRAIHEIDATFGALSL